MLGYIFLYTNCLVVYFHAIKQVVGAKIILLYTQEFHNQSFMQFRVTVHVIYALQ